MSRSVKCNTYQGKRKKGKSHFPQIQLQSNDSTPLPEFTSKIKGSIWKISLRLKPASELMSKYKSPDIQIGNKNHFGSASCPKCFCGIHGTKILTSFSKLTSLIFELEIKTTYRSSEASSF